MCARCISIQYAEVDVPRLSSHFLAEAVGSKGARLPGIAEHPESVVDGQLEAAVGQLQDTQEEPTPQHPLPAVEELGNREGQPRNRRVLQDAHDVDEPEAVFGQPANIDEPIGNRGRRQDNAAPQPPIDPDGDNDFEKDEVSLSNLCHSLVLILLILLMIYFLVSTISEDFKIGLIDGVIEDVGAAVDRLIT